MCVDLCVALQIILAHEALITMILMADNRWIDRSPDYRIEPLFSMAMIPNDHDPPINEIFHNREGIAR